MARLAAALIFGLALMAAPLAAQDLPSIEEKTDGMETMDGFFPLYWDAAEGTVWMEVPELDEEFLYVNYLSAGLGSNDVGLDRGQLGDERVVHFERVGPQVLLVKPNQTYRAHTDNPAERQAVDDAFAEGVLWGFEAAAETGDRVLVDATDFIVRDVHDVTQRLQQTGQGAYQLDASRSTPDLERTKSFPENTEMEARLTFTTDESPGSEVQTTAAEPTSFAVRVRHSFVDLPDTEGFSRRAHHPRSGYYSFDYEDYAAPVTEDMTQRYIPRHRLTCEDPPDDDGLCTPEEPIVYYLDPGTPEPVRTALLDGARWWNDAFEAAGYRDAFQVEMLPEDADPMDIRYNVIQWVHRSTRGWSYGPSVTDPRTGEILKGHIVLGSLRVRQDLRLAEGLLAPYADDHAAGLPDEDNPMLDMALDRIRQLSAHEVGHTLGLRHNFAASVNDRASVMDYPAPYAKLDETGAVTLEDAYDTGIAAWDEVAIRYGYAEPDNGETEEELLDRVMQEFDDEELLYITDADARPTGAAHPHANLWDNGDDMIEALEHEMAVRDAALDTFGENVIRTGEPHALMEEVLVPLYLRHRYQIEATAKLLGGVEYAYTLRGEEQPAPSAVPGDQQRAGLEALLDVLAPEQLRLPPEAREQIAPRPPGYSSNRELFPRHTGLTFDAHAPAEVVATMVFDQLLNPERAARLAYQRGADPDLPAFREVLDRTTDALWDQPVPDDAYNAELQRTTQQVWVEALLEHADHGDLAPAVQRQLTDQIRALRGWLDEHPGTTETTQAHRSHVRDMIDRFLNRSHEAATPRAEVEPPPGSPIGQAEPAYIERQEQRRSWLDDRRPHENTCGPRF